MYSLGKESFSPSFYNAETINENACWTDLLELPSGGRNYEFRFRYEASVGLHVLTSSYEPDNTAVPLRMTFRFGSDDLAASTPCNNLECWCHPFLTDRKHLQGRSLLCLGRQLLARWEKFFPDTPKVPQRMVSQGSPVAPPPKRAPTSKAPPAPVPAPHRLPLQDLPCLTVIPCLPLTQLGVLSEPALNS